MIGHFLKVSSIAAKRSGARASILGAALILSVGGVNRAQAHVPTSPDTVKPAQTDTTNNLVVSADTSKEVKHVVKKGDTLWDLASFYLRTRSAGRRSFAATPTSLKIRTGSTRAKSSASGGPKSSRVHSPWPIALAKSSHTS